MFLIKHGPMTTGARNSMRIGLIQNGLGRLDLYMESAISCILLLISANQLPSKTVSLNTNLYNKIFMDFIYEDYIS